MSNQQSLKESDINLTSNVLPVNKKDDIILIWFDNCNIDQNIKNQFEQLHDDCLQCFNITELTDSITNIIDKNIFLIISNQYSEETLQLFHDNEKLDSFYIICINKQVYQNQKEYSKLIGVYVQRRNQDF
ncbi:unnamed protein product [Didymodactylos carnosus]|uniref:Uncharacterized protein n=1 Tax=Didymodactylos carnosus TaxID=1234261 RepID=A0A8S2FNE4_9BILA|nr:unnamed protein product [Didymodactylos carnosus]CAF4307930.1 unnamed protein product [Didymodactylos carnosus]